MVTENRLIAEFMGYEFVDGDFRIPHSDKTTNSNFSEWCSTYGDIDGMFSVGYLLAPSNLMFHSDWNWLMEVVEKIEGLDFIFSIHHEVVNIFNGECNVLTYNETTQNKTKIQAVYSGVVEFIKWYNEQK